MITEKEVKKMLSEIKREYNKIFRWDNELRFSDFPPEKIEKIGKKINGWYHSYDDMLSIKDQLQHTIYYLKKILEER